LKTKFPKDVLMVDRKTGRHLMRSEWLLEKMADARQMVTALEQEWLEFIEPEKVVPVVEDKSFTEILHYWQQNGPPQINLQDETESFVSHADGKRYTSKRKYRDELKARDMVEIGDERGAFEDLGKVDEKAAEQELKETINRAIPDTIND